MINMIVLIYSLNIAYRNSNLTIYQVRPVLFIMDVLLYISDFYRFKSWNIQVARYSTLNPYDHDIFAIATFLSTISYNLGTALANIS